MTASEIIELAEKIVAFVKGQDKKAVIAALQIVHAAIIADESTAAVVD